jgi:excisionase family DNA binding protein
MAVGIGKESWESDTHTPPGKRARNNVTQFKEQKMKRHHSALPITRTVHRQVVKAMRGEYEPLINDAEAAAFLGGLHAKTVQRMARRRELPSYRVGRYWRYRASELAAWLVLQSSGQYPPAQTKKESSK